jgi:predicted DNA-binding transcriptional regulator AlpA
VPRPVKLGELVRWGRDAIRAWIARGSPFRTKGTGR